MTPAHRRWAYVAVLAAGLALGCVLWQIDRVWPDPIVIVLLAAMALVAEWRQLDTGESVTISLSSVLTLTAAFLTGPVGGATVGLIALGLVPTVQRPIARCFNGVMSGILGFTAGWVYELATGWPADQLWSRPGIPLHVVIPVTLATFVMFVLNAILVAGMMRVGGDSPRMRSTVRVILSHSAMPYLVSGIAAFLFVTLWAGGRLGPLSALLMAAPLLLAQWALQEQARVLLAQRRTLDMFGALIDANLPERAARTAEIQRVARIIGAQVNLSPRELARLRSAARLVDLGRVWAKRCDVLPEEDDARAQAMVAGITHLEEPVRIVRERRTTDGQSTQRRRTTGSSTTAQVLALSEAAVDGGELGEQADNADPRVLAAYRSALSHHAISRTGEA